MEQEQRNTKMHTDIERSKSWDTAKTTPSSVSFASPQEELNVLKRWVDNEEQVLIHAQVSLLRFQEGFDHFRVIIQCEDHRVFQEDSHNFSTHSFESSIYPIASTTIPKSIGMFSIFDELKVQLINLSEEDGGLIEQISIPVICIDRKESSTLKLTDFGVEVAVTFNIVSIAPTPEKIDHILQGTVVGSQVVPTTRIIPVYKKNVNTATKSMEKTVWKLKAGDLVRLFQALYMSLLLGGHTFKHMLSLCLRIILLLNHSSQHLVLSLTGFNIEMFQSFQNLLILFTNRITDIPQEMQLCVLELLESVNLLVHQQYEAQLKPTLKATLKTASPLLCPVMKILKPISNIPLGSSMFKFLPASSSDNFTFLGHLVKSSSAILTEVHDLCQDCLQDWEEEKK